MGKNKCMVLEEEDKSIQPTREIRKSNIPSDEGENTCS